MLYYSFHINKFCYSSASLTQICMETLRFDGLIWRRKQKEQRNRRKRYILYHATFSQGCLRYATEGSPSLEESKEQILQNRHHQELEIESVIYSIFRHRFQCVERSVQKFTFSNSVILRCFLQWLGSADSCLPSFSCVKAILLEAQKLMQPKI